MNWIKCLIHGHNYQFKLKASVFENNFARRPMYEKHCFMCSRCLKKKEVKF